MATGHPVQVISFVDSLPGHSLQRRPLKLDRTVLREITGLCPKECPIIIIAIAGPKGRGKSFILSCFVQYLTSLHESTLEGSDPPTPETWFGPSVSIKDNGFKYQNTTNFTTNGIWFWSTPFIIPAPSSTSSSDRIAVLLMDTQGCFDSFSTEAEQSAIIGLSLLSSSSFIFNESLQLNENTLTTLSRFMHYGQVATQTFSQKYFQRLMFLIRDWNYPDLHSYGASGGQKFIHEHLTPQPGMTEEAIENRRVIQTTFEHFNCYLMPYPGRSVISNKFTGLVSDMDKEFREHIQKFVVAIVEDSTAKKMAGKEIINGSEFLHLMYHYVDAFNSDELPSPNSILQATIYSAYESRLSDLQTFYKEKMSGKFENNIFLLPGEIQAIHSKLKEKVGKKFGKIKNFGTEINFTKENFTRRLNDEIEIIFRDLKTNFENRQKETILSAEKNGEQIFLSAMKNSLGSRNENQFWSQEEFENFGESAVESGMEGFLKLCPVTPPEQFYGPFIHQLDELKLSLWAEEEEKVKKAEGKVLKVIQQLAQDYVDYMRILLEDEAYVPLEKLGDWHSKQFKNAASFFNRNQEILVYSPGFIESQEKILEFLVLEEFDKIQKKNEGKMKGVQTSLETIVQDAMDLYTEEARKILENLLTASPGQLEKKCEEILEDADKYLKAEDPGHSSQFYKMYKKTLEADMRENLRKFQKELESSEEKRELECQRIVQTFSDTYKGKMEGIVQESVQKVSTEEKLRREMKNAENDLRPSAEMKIREFKCKPQTTSAYLSQIGVLVDQKNEESVGEFRIKMWDAEEKARGVLEKLEKEFDVKMTVRGEPCVDLDGLEGEYKKIVGEFERKMENQDDVHPRMLEEIKRKLREYMERIYEEKREDLIEKEEQRKMVVESVSGEVMKEYEETIREIVKKNPFLTQNEVELKESKIYGVAVEKFQKRLSTENPSSPRTIADMVKNFKAVLKAKKEFVAQITQKSRLKAEEKISSLETRHFLSFTEKASKLPFHQLTESQVDVQTTKLIEQITAQFQDEWEFPTGLSRKQEVIKEFKRKLRQHLQNLQESEEVKEQHAIQILNNIMNSLCPELAASLNDGCILDDKALEDEWKIEIEEKKIELTRQLQVRGIEPVEKLTQFVEQCEEKLVILQAQNIGNLDAVKNETREKLRSFCGDRAAHIRNKESLEKFKLDLKEEAMGILKEKFKGEEENLEKYEKEMMTLAKNHYEKIWKSLLGKSEEKTSKILEMAKLKYKTEMDNCLKEMDSVHPTQLIEYNERCLYLTMQEISRRWVVVSETVKFKVTQGLENSFRIYREKNDKAHDTSTSSAIGIDLGTTTSCVSVMKDGRAVVIQDGSGNNLTPSYVHYPLQGLPVVGVVAKEEAQKEPENVVYDAKRLIGRLFTDPLVQADMEIWPFKVVSDAQNRPLIQVRGVKYPPEEVSAQVLIRMKKIAEEFLEKGVTDAVITVPANFSDSQRDATRQAAQVAGLNVLQIINEPTAAAIAHAITWNDEERIVLVFDFGGGTFDVSILKTGGIVSTVEEDSSGPKSTLLGNKTESNDNGGLQVLTTAGDTHLGGEDVDADLVKYCVSEFERINAPAKLLDIPDISARAGNNTFFAVKRRQRRLKNECERVKVALTTAESVTASIDSVYGDLDLNIPIKREILESRCLHLFQRAIDITKRALDEAKVKKEDVTDVILVGGSSRIPKVKEMLEGLLGKHSITIDQQINIQESVAMGAAIQASILSGGSIASRLRVKDVQSFSLGIKVEGGEMEVIIPRNSEIPCQKTKTFVTTYTNQREAEIQIYSGENKKKADENSFLGSFTVTDIPRGPKGSQNIDVLMKIDSNGILDVTATCKGNGRSQNLVIEESRGRLSEDQVEQMRMRAAMGGAYEADSFEF